MRPPPYPTQMGELPAARASQQAAEKNPDVEKNGFPRLIGKVVQHSDQLFRKEQLLLRFLEGPQPGDN